MYGRIYSYEGEEAQAYCKILSGEKEPDACDMIAFSLAPSATMEASFRSIAKSMGIPLEIRKKLTPDVVKTIEAMSGDANIRKRKTGSFQT